MVEVVYDFAIEVHSDWEFIDGDLKLVSYDENLCQAIRNRLNTNLDELYLFYEDYGSVLSGFLGWKSNEETLSFIKLEVDNCLKNDSRLFNFNSEVTYNGKGVLEIKISVNYQGIVKDFNYILNNDGLVEEV